MNKNKGNTLLETEIAKLISDIETNNWKNPDELLKIRNDADKVHPDGFYFFNIGVHRTMILVEFSDDEATIIWCGDHKTYESTFRNNRATIKMWLKSKNWIE